MTLRKSKKAVRITALDLIGTDQADFLRGRNGNDTISGQGGNDVLLGMGGNDTIDGGEGNDLIDGGTGNDIMTGGAGNDVIFGGAGKDMLDGGEGDDVLIAGSGEDIMLGGAGNDLAFGGSGRDYADGGEGNDILLGGGGHDVLLGGAGDDIIEGGSGGDVLLGGEGNDRIDGGAHNDYLDGGAGDDRLKGGTGNDMIDAGEGDDLVEGDSGDDSVLDGYGNDVVDGGAGADSLANSWGNDVTSGGAGHDRIVSYSDAGEPVPAQDANGLVNAGEPLADSDDILTGGSGADTFWFELALDAKQAIIAKYTDANTGRVDWAGVTGENGAVHDHWLEAFGDDVILDFNRRQGDRIAIEGHTVSVASIEQVDANGDGARDYSLITLISQQGAAGAHDEDQLGTIKVYGDAVTLADISLDATPTFGADTFEGLIPVYGTLGNDRIAAGRGEQVLYGGDGNDVLVAYSDGGEPVPAQDANGKVYAYDPSAPADDVLIGGDGNDTFNFKLLLNAKQEILDEHRQSGGRIDWAGVTGENGNVHDHWLDSIGNDVIYDFDSGENGEHGDQILIEGHTVHFSLQYFDTVSDADTDTEADYTVISLWSDQGAAGAHDEDPLGTITVYGDLVDADDIHLNANVTYGIDMMDGSVY